MRAFLLLLLIFHPQSITRHELAVHHKLMLARLVLLTLALHLPLMGMAAERPDLVIVLADDLGQQGDRQTVFAEPRLLSDPHSFGPTAPSGDATPKPTGASK